MISLVTFASGLDVSENQHLLDSCNKGRLHQCYKFARYYHVSTWDGSYEEKYYSVAIKPYKRACKGNMSNACFELGEMYMLGRGVQANSHKAVYLFKKACVLNHIGGCMLGGEMYELEIGVKQNYQKALEFYTKECSIGKTEDYCENRNRLLKLILDKPKELANKLNESK